VYQSDTEILFPMRVAPSLRELRGEAWRTLVDRVTQSPDASVDQLAFSLMLVRLDGCLTCHTDSYRAMRGCTICATQAIRRFKGDDQDLIALFERSREEVLQNLRVDRRLVRTQELVTQGGFRGE
jgi:hypothetical protein